MNIVGIGDKLKQLRNERDMSMDNLVADLNRLYGLNLTKSMISRWESNKNDPPLTITFVVFPGASRTFVRVYVGLSQNQT